MLAGYSPSELLMSPILGSTVPTTRAQRAPQVPDSDVVQTKDHEDKARQKWFPPWGLNTATGNVVWLPDRQTENVLQDKVAPQSFEVVSPDGSYRQNRQDIIQLPASQAGNSSDESELSENVPTTQLNQSSEPQWSSHVPQPERRDPSWIKQWTMFTNNTLSCTNTCIIITIGPDFPLSSCTNSGYQTLFSSPTKCLGTRLGPCVTLNKAHTKCT